jgi:hypothetical protein
VYNTRADGLTFASIIKRTKDTANKLSQTIAEKEVATLEKIDRYRVKLLEATTPTDFNLIIEEAKLEGFTTIQKNQIFNSFLELLKNKGLAMNSEKLVVEAEPLLEVVPVTVETEVAVEVEPLLEVVEVAVPKKQTNVKIVKSKLEIEPAETGTVELLIN